MLLHVCVLERWGNGVTKFSSLAEMKHSKNISFLISSTLKFFLAEGAHPKVVMLEMDIII